MRPSLLATLVGSSMLALASPDNSEKKSHKAILDNDWGADGFVPFLVAMSGDIEVLGLVSDTANTWQRQCALHALATLEMGGLDKCFPVYEGATYPLIQTPNRMQAWEMVHGMIPFAGAFRPENATAEKMGEDPASGNPNRINRAAFIEGYPNSTVDKSTNAANFMVESVRKYPGQVSIYSAGSLTNIALAVRMDAEFASLAKELIVMGGYVDVTFLEATGDFLQSDVNSDINLMIDPEAAKIAITADFPKITIAGNVANSVYPTQKFLDEVYQVKNNYTKFFHDTYRLEFPFWDETAAAIMIDPSIITNQTSIYMDVDVAYGSPSYGNVHVYKKELAPPSARPVNYVHEINHDQLYEIIKNSLQHPKTCGEKHAY